MKKKPYFPIVLAVISSAHGASVTFHSDFDEATLGDITGLNVDTPTESGANNSNDGSGTVVLNTTNQTLDLTSMDANMWTTRDGAPIAWVSSPSVTVGETWFVQSQLTHTDSAAGVATGYDQAGILFYSGVAGSNPGSENPGDSTGPGAATLQSLFAGINDWNAWSHTTQGFADNEPHSVNDNSVAASPTDDTFEYRIEITEGGASDTYNFFYREDPADPWSSIGLTDYVASFDNTAVGLFQKSHNNNTGATTAFDYLTVGTLDPIPEPSTGLLAGLAGLALVIRRRRK